MVWGTGETGKLQAEALSGRDCQEMFARNKEEVYGGGPVSGLTTTQPTANNSVKHSSHLLGHFPLMMRPLHPKHSETHLDTSALGIVLLGRTGKTPRRHCHPSVWGGLLSQWGACQVRKIHKSRRVVKGVGELGEPQLSFMVPLPGDSVDSGRTRLLINLTGLCQKLPHG